jgi:hypothetical protein
VSLNPSWRPETEKTQEKIKEVAEKENDEDDGDLGSKVCSVLATTWAFK